MTAKWMFGTAFAAIVVATPALAQDKPTTEFGECALSEMTNETFMGLDANDDSGLSMDEYRNCLSQAGITLDDQQTAAFEKAYTDADANSDASLVMVEVESAGSMDTASADTANTDAPKGTVTVTQPAAQVTVTEPAAQVNVAQPAPKVNVETQQPTVDVATQKPEVDVTQPKATVEVEQGQPKVAVSQPEPTVSVNQPEAQVAVQAGQPAVKVEEQKPEVAVTTPKPEVEVTQPDLAVDVNQAQPDVAVTQAQPDIAVSQTDAATTAEPQMAAATADTAVAAPMETTYQIRIDDLEGADVMNTAGDEIGSIESVLLDPSANAPVVVLSVGGLLGIGDKEIAFPYNEFTITGDDVVLNTDMSEDQIKDMPEYDEGAYEALPDTMIVR